MSSEPRPNYYIILGLSLDPPEDNWNVIEAVILKRQTEWSQRSSGNGPRARAATSHLSLLSPMKACLADEHSRRAEAQAAIGIRDRARQQLLADLDSIIEVLCAKRRVAAEEMKSLIAEFSEKPPEYCRLAPDDIRKRIKVKIDEPAPTPAAAPASLDPRNADQIREHLESLGKKDLYDFLERSPSSSETILSARAQEVYNENISIANKTPAVSAKTTLAGFCSTVFKDAAKRRSYDVSLRMEKLLRLEQYIAVVGAKGIIEAGEYDALVAKAVSWGATKAEAEEYINSKTQKKNWKIQVPIQFTVDGLVRCLCGHLNPRLDKHCGRCGHSLGMVTCPKCGSEQPVTDRVCTQCGFALGDMSNARSLIDKARHALLREGKTDEAERYLRQAESFWPGNSEVQKLRQHIKMESALPLIAKARSAFQMERNAREAERLIMQAEAICPANPDIAQLKDLISDERGRADQAAKALEAAVKGRDLAKVPSLFENLRHWAPDHPGLTDARWMVAGIQAAQDWQRKTMTAIRAREAPALRSIADEMAVLGQLVKGRGHFEFLPSKDRDWAEKRMVEARAFIEQVERFLEALARCNDKDIVEAWGDGTLLSKVAETHAKKNLVVSAKKRLQVTLEFHNACHAGNEREIACVYKASPSLQDPAVANSPCQGMMTIRQRAELAERRVAAVDELSRLIRNQDDPEHPGKDLDTILEQQIADWHNRHCRKGGLLDGSEFAKQEVTRARYAESRLAAFAKLQATHTGGNKPAFRKEAEKCSVLLAQYPPAQPLLEDYARWKNVQIALAEIQQSYAEDCHNDDHLIALWTKHACIFKDPALRSDPDWSHVEQLVATARMRVGILRTVQEALKRNPMDFQRIAACWDESLCAGHPQVAGLRKKIETALALNRLGKAIRADSDTAIRDAWNPELLAGTQYVEDNANRIRLAVLIPQLAKPPFEETQTPLEYENESRQLSVSWQWLNEQIEECAVLVKDGGYPQLKAGETPDSCTLVSLRQFRQAKGTWMVVFKGHCPHVVVAPVVKFLKERFVAEPFLKLNLVTITYVIRRSLWSLLLPSSRPKIQIRSRSGRIRVGPLLVIGQEVGGGPDSAKVMGKLPAGWLNGRAPAQVHLDTSQFPLGVDVEVTLRPELKSKGELIKILSPEPANRTLAR